MVVKFPGLYCEPLVAETKLQKARGHEKRRESPKLSDDCVGLFKKRIHEANCEKIFWRFSLDVTETLK